MRGAQLGRFKVVLSGAAVLVAGCASGAAMGRYTVSGINPFYAQQYATDYDPGARVGLDRDEGGYEDSVSSVSYAPSPADRGSLSPVGGDYAPRPF